MSSSAIKLLVQTSRPDWNQFLQLLNTAFSIRESRKACFPTRRTNRPPQSPVLTIRKKTGTWNTTDSSDPFRVSVLPSLVCNRKKKWNGVRNSYQSLSRNFCARFSDVISRGNLSGDVAKCRLFSLICLLRNGPHDLAGFFRFFFFLKHDNKIDNNIRWKGNRLNVLAFSFEKAVM